MAHQTHTNDATGQGAYDRTVKNLRGQRRGKGEGWYGGRRSISRSRSLRSATILESKRPIDGQQHVDKVAYEEEMEHSSFSFDGPSQSYANRRCL